MEVVQNEISKNKGALGEKLRIQEDHSRRKNIKVDSIEEDENETWENTENTEFFLIWWTRNHWWTFSRECTTCSKN